MAYRDHIWANPGAGANIEWSDPFWLRSTVMPMARFKVNESNASGGIARTPPGYSAQALTAAGAGIMGANWVKYLTDQMALIGRTYTGYSLIPQQFGVAVESDYTDDPPNCPCLCQNYRDRITAPVGVTTETTVNTRFCAQGIGLVDTWVDAFLDSFESTRVTHGVDAPSYSHIDFEHDPNELFATDNDGTGNWQYEIVDARWDTELVDGTNTMSALWAAALDINGDAITVTNDWAMQRTRNQRFCEWLAGVRQNVGEWAVKTTYKDKLLSLYASCKMSNFSYSNSTRAYPFPGPRSWRNDFNRTISHMYYQHITFYPLNETSFTDLANSSYEDQLERYGVVATGDLDDDLDALNVARWKIILQNAVASNPDLPIVLSLPAPGYTRDLDILQDGYTYELTKDPLIDFVRYAVTTVDPEDYYWWMDDTVTQQNWDDLGDVLDARTTIKTAYAEQADADLANILSVTGIALDRVVARPAALDRLVSRPVALDRFVSRPAALDRLVLPGRALDRIVVQRPEGG